MVKKYALFEHASGYAIFKIIAHEEVGILLDQVQESISELDRFGKIIKLFAYYAFSSALMALENAISISNGELSDDLLNFVQSNVKASKKVLLGVSDPKLSSLIHEKTGVNCFHNDVVAEITRGIRMHFPKFMKGSNLGSILASQVGLGHSLSRSKIQYNAQKSDNSIIQSMALLEQLDKDINTFSQRIREWYSYHFPELYNIVKSNLLYAKAVNIIGNRTNLSKEMLEELSVALGSEETSQKIYQASVSSIGVDMMDIDLNNIKSFCSRVIELVDYRESLMEYLIAKMNLIAPNLSSVIGETVGAKLISQAGSLINLAKCPASTVQILGAEKSLFRALKTRGKTPKYGIIFHSSFIGRSPTRYKGRISRLIAHKCSLASRIDTFSECPNNIIGQKLHEQIEERLNYFIKGEPQEEDQIPRSNAEVMQEAVDALNEYKSKACGKSKKSIKKKRKTILT